MSKVYKDATLHLFKFFLSDDIEGQTLSEILFKKPDGTTGTWTPIQIHEQLGRLDWKPGLGELDQSGKWELQAKVTLPTGVVYGEIIQYEIYEPIL